MLDLSYDDRGNAISYVYKPENGVGAPSVASEVGRTVGANRYLKQVLYGNDEPYLPGVQEYSELPTQDTDWLFRPVLDYGEHGWDTPTPAEEGDWSCRADPFSSYRAGFEIRTYRTCRRLLMFHQIPEQSAQPVLVRSTDITYETSDAPGDPTLPSLTMLSSVTQTGWIATDSGGYEPPLSLPALDLSYSLLRVNNTVQAAAPENFVGGFDGTRERWVDLDGEALQRILTEDDGGWYYKHNLSVWAPDGGPASARFGPVTPVVDKPSRGSLALTDLNADGNPCAVSFALHAPGWFEYDADTGWMPFRQLAATASVDWASPNLRFVDLNGDGLADVLITEDDAITWYPWEVDEGFGELQRVIKPFDEDVGPGLVLADGTGAIYLADMSGDGLADLIRIRNGEVCYWPNVGYGHFGAEITMDAAPVFDYPDAVDQRRIRLADVDGSGIADLVHLGAQAIIDFNQSGNGWTAGTALEQFPTFAPELHASVFDLLRTGTACAVWTSALRGDSDAPLRYINLTGGQMPHLLTGAVNNLGAWHPEGDGFAPVERRGPVQRYLDAQLTLLSDANSRRRPNRSPAARTRPRGGVRIHAVRQRVVTAGRADCHRRRHRRRLRLLGGGLRLDRDARRAGPELEHRRGLCVGERP
jgi:hypothetical protein